MANNLQQMGGIAPALNDAAQQQQFSGSNQQIGVDVEVAVPQTSAESPKLIMGLTREQILYRDGKKPAEKPDTLPVPGSYYGP